MKHIFHHRSKNRIFGGLVIFLLISLIDHIRNVLVSLIKSANHSGKCVWSTSLVGLEASHDRSVSGFAWDNGNSIFRSFTFSFLPFSLTVTPLQSHTHTHSNLWLFECDQEGTPVMPISLINRRLVKLPQ